MLRAHLRDILMVGVKTQNNGFLTVTFLCFASLVVKYLSGKLDDDTKYAVFQRSFHTVDDYENEGFIIFTTNKDNTAAVVAGVVVPLIVVAIIVVVVVLYIRRRNRDKAADGEHVPMNSKPSGIGELFFRKVAKRFFGIRDFPYLKNGIPDWILILSEIGRDLRLKLYTGGGMSKLNNHRDYDYY